MARKKKKRKSAHRRSKRSAHGQIPLALLKKRLKKLQRVVDSRS